MKSKFDQSLDNAIDAFWQSIASSYPEAKSRDMAPDQDIAFENAASLAIDQWLNNNIADKAHTRDEDCSRYVNSGCCPVCNVGHGEPGCLTCGAQAYHKPGCKESDAEGSVLENQIIESETAVSPIYSFDSAAIEAEMSKGIANAIGAIREQTKAEYSEDDYRQDWRWDVRNDRTTLAFPAWLAKEKAIEAVSAKEQRGMILVDDSLPCTCDANPESVLSCKRHGDGEHETTTSTNDLLRFVIDYLDEEDARGTQAPDSQDIKDLVASAIDAYEGGAR